MSIVAGQGMRGLATGNVYGGKGQDRAPSESARGSIIAGLVVLALFFVGLGGWAGTAPLNGAVVAPAVIKVEGNRKSIQHLDGGIVGQILVKEGSQVAVGQTLMVLEAAQPKAALAILKGQFDALRLQEARLLAERDDAAAVRFPPDLMERRADPEIGRMVDSEEHQFEVRRGALTGQTAVLRQRIQQVQEQIRGAKVRQAELQQEISLIDLEIKDQRTLLQKELTTRPKVLALERNAASLRGQHGEVVGSIAKARQAIAEIDLTIIQVHTDRMAEVARDLRETQFKIADLIPRLQAAQDVVERTEIRSPYAGHVVDLSVFSVGAVIQRGERIMDIVPSRSDLIAEVSVSVDDIHELHPGMKAEVRLSGYKQRVMPALKGKVIDVAADRVTDQRTGVPYYTALVRVDEGELAAARDVVLQAGMSAAVIIPTVERTALDYLVGPFLSSFDQAFRQR